MQKRHLLVAALATVGVLLYHFGVPMFLLESQQGGLELPSTVDSGGEKTADEAESEPTDEQGSDAPNRPGDDSAEANDDEPPLEDQPLAERIPKGEQAYFLEFPNDGAFYRMLQPGDRVDLVAVVDREDLSEAVTEEFDAEDQPDAPGTRRLALTGLQNVTILDVRPHPREGTSGATLLLSVTDEEHHLLRLLGGPGSMHLQVRHPENVRIHAVDNETFRSMLDNHDIQRKRRRNRLEERWRAHRRESEKGRKEGADDPAESDSDESPKPPEIACDGDLSTRVMSKTDEDYEVRAGYFPASLPAGTVDCGDRVDVLAEFGANEAGVPTDGETSADRISSTLVEAVPVLEVVREDSAIVGLVLGAAYRNLMQIRLAQRYGRLDYALRHPDDPRAAPIGGVDKSLRDVFDNLFMIAPTPRPEPDEFDGDEIEIMDVGEPK